MTGAGSGRLVVSSVVYAVVTVVVECAAVHVLAEYVATCEKPGVTCAQPVAIDGVTCVLAGVVTSLPASAPPEHGSVVGSVYVGRVGTAPVLGVGFQRLHFWRGWGSYRCPSWCLRPCIRIALCDRYMFRMEGRHCIGSVLAGVWTCLWQILSSEYQPRVGLHSLFCLGRGDKPVVFAWAFCWRVWNSGRLRFQQQTAVRSYRYRHVVTGGRKGASRALLCFQSRTCG